MTIRSIPRIKPLDPPTFGPRAPVIALITGIAFAAIAIGALLIAPHAAALLHTFKAHPLAFGLSLGLGVPAITFLAIKHLKATPHQPVPNRTTLATLTHITKDKATFAIKSYSHPHFTITIFPYKLSTFARDRELIQTEIATVFDIKEHTPTPITLDNQPFDMMIANLPGRLGATPKLLVQPMQAIYSQQPAATNE